MCHLYLLHEENVHYNLVIPRNCKLALDGGLDDQRNERANDAKNNKVTIPEKKNLNDTTIKALTDKITELETKVELLENENKYLKGVLDENGYIKVAQDEKDQIKVNNTDSETD